MMSFQISNNTNIPVNNMTCNARSKATAKIPPRKKTMLPDSFWPLPYSVIIGKGKMPALATGNRRLRILVDMQIQNYANAQFKRDKTVIVTTVLHAVQEACPVGAFVRFDGERWWEVPDSISREKIACMLRDCLSGIYRSSNKNKVERRRAKKAQQRSNHAKQLARKTAGTEMYHFSATPLNMTLEQIPPIVFGGFDLLNMYESVDETIFDDEKPAKTVAEAAAQVVSDEEASNQS